MKTYSAEELRTLDERREHIADLFLHGQWKGTASRRELAEKWNMRRGELHTLEDAAITACRLAVKEDWPNRVAMALAELDAVKTAAWDMKRIVCRKDEDPEVIPQPDLKVIIDATKLQLQVYGALGQPMAKTAPQKDDDFDAMPNAEKRNILEQALRDLGDEGRRLQ